MQRFVAGMVAIVLMAAGSAVFAKDLSSRLGVGYTNQFGLEDDLPSMAVRYFPNNNYGVAAALGVDTEDKANRFGLMARFIRVVFREDNMNFYVAAQGGFVSREKDDKNDSGFDLAGVFGGEFFMPGLENLGFNFEAGVGATSISSEMRFRTIGDSPLRAGIFFYF